jgi:hypothetical protein
MFFSLNTATFERISITEFRKAPGRALRNLRLSGLILYSHNRICGYVLNKRSIDALMLEVSRANSTARNLTELLMALHPDLLSLKSRRPDLSVRIDSFLSSMIATNPSFRPREMVRRLS